MKIKNLKVESYFYNLLFIIVSVITFLNVDYGLTFDKKISPKLIIDETFLPSITVEDSIYSLKLLNYRINELLNAKEMQNSNYSVSVFSIDKQRYFYQKNANTKLTPASTTKLITSFIYLVSNYPDYTIRTSVYADAPYPNKGVINSDIYLYGRGNVLLKESDLDSIAIQLKNKGIKEINGDIVADDSFFDGIKNRFKYSGDLDEVQAVSDISALGMNKNHYTITVRANPETGKADIIMNPRSDAFKFINNTKVLAHLQDNEIEENPNFDKDYNKKYNKNFITPFDYTQEYGDAYPTEIEYNSNVSYNNNFTYNFINNDFAAKRKAKGRAKKSKGKAIAAAGAKISISKIADGEYNVSISGNLKKNYINSFYYRIENPEIFTAGALKSALERNGITCNGKLKHHNNNDFKYYGSEKEIAFVKNDIYDMMKLVNKNSDNFIAEHFFKINGTFYKDFNSNYEAANYLLQKVADSLNLNSLKCIINDGSGLSRRNKITTETLIDILNFSAKMKFGSYFDSTLAIAGVDGTLKKRMIGTNAQNNVKAKTGTHRNVSALAGYVLTRDSEKLCFSIISNGNYVYAYKQIEDQIATLLADFKYVQKPNKNDANLDLNNKKFKIIENQNNKNDIDFEQYNDETYENELEK